MPLSAPQFGGTGFANQVWNQANETAKLQPSQKPGNSSGGNSSGGGIGSVIKKGVENLATEVLGGGPEDPLADAAVAAEDA